MLKLAMIALTTSYIAWFLERHEDRVVYPFDKTYSVPSDAGEPRLKETPFQTADGETLILWEAPPPGDRPIVLYLPGNSGTLADRTPRFSALIDRGFGVTALAYRGSSGSTGRPSEAALTQDAIAVAQSYEGRNLILYGESLGSALAVKLAAEEIGNAVVLEAPFLSIPDLLAVQYPAEDLRHLFTQTWASKDRMGDIDQPLLIIHGTEDRLVPFFHGETLFERAGSEKKRLIAIKGSDHSGLWTEAAVRELSIFLSQQ